ncbi:hypothetical protein [Amycolatopsis benzoatilytica]|uniref:hypothetical protein n=1 Tax=Amycolatopsis benzoatilytica TaxID=346045 RepID=UPI000369B6A8|nr:hypothetical protein [Amycolatopsis benzoatilytica]
MNTPAGRVALVTGAGQSVGHGIALALAGAAEQALRSLPRTAAAGLLSSLAARLEEAAPWAGRECWSRL